MAQFSRQYEEDEWLRKQEYSGYSARQISRQTEQFGRWNRECRKSDRPEHKRKKKPRPTTPAKIFC
ncbi:MAG: hypothetical protein ABSG63_15120 [Spirochaetia bacterium]